MYKETKALLSWGILLKLAAPAILHWETRRFLIVVMAVQIAFWGLIGLDVLGFPVGFLRQFVGFIYLTFIPGILVLRLLRLYDLNFVESVLYAIGLSIAIIMFTGFLLNTICPLVGLDYPISLYPLVISISGVVTFMMVLCLKDWHLDLPALHHDPIVVSPSFVLLLILPMLSIIGTYFVNIYSNNVILWILIPLLALVPYLVLFNKIPERLYPLAVFSISISLLYHTTLISNYIWGWDINVEYYFANLVLLNSQWDPSISSNVNAMLSVVMIAPLYSILLNMDLTSVFKVIYPAIFSFLPLILFLIYRKQTSMKIAFLSCFFFVSYEFFYVNAPTGGRQEIVELFLGLVLFLLLDNSLHRPTRSFLLVTFMCSMIVSHYGTSYLFILILLGVWFFTSLTKHVDSSKISYSNLVPTIFVLLTICFTFAWYGFMSDASAFNTIIHIGDHIVSSISSEFLNLESSQGMQLVLSGASYGLMVHLEKYIQLIAIFFIFVGVLWLLFCNGSEGVRFRPLYTVFCLGYFGLNSASLVVPFFAAQLNTWRIYHLTLIVLSPLVIIGGTYIFKFFTRRRVQFSRVPFALISVFLTIFLLFNSAWIYGVVDEYPKSVRSLALHQNSVAQGDDSGRNELYTAYYLDQDVYSVGWLAEYRKPDIAIYADSGRENLILRSYGMLPGQKVMTNSTSLSDAYLYLGYPNVKYGIMRGTGLEYWHIHELTPILSDTNLLYENGGATVIYR